MGSLAGAETRSQLSKKGDRIRGAMILAAGLVLGVVAWRRGWAAGQVAANIPGPTGNPSQIKDAYSQAIERVLHYDDMLVTIGTVALGILAWFGTAVFGTDHRMGPSEDPAVDPVAEGRRLTGAFWIIVLVSLMTTVAYTHVFRYYAACTEYAVALEIAGQMNPIVRPTSATWNMMRTPATFLSLDPDFTFVCIGLYAAFLSSAAVWLFGSRLRQRVWIRASLISLIMPAALAYILPVAAAYLVLADRAGR